MKMQVALHGIFLGFNLMPSPQQLDQNCCRIIHNIIIKYISLYICDTILCCDLMNAKKSCPKSPHRSHFLSAVPTASITSLQYGIFFKGQVKIPGVEEHKEVSGFYLHNSDQ